MKHIKSKCDTYLSKHTDKFFPLRTTNKLLGRDSLYMCNSGGHYCRCDTFFSIYVYKFFPLRTTNKLLGHDSLYKRLQIKWRRILRLFLQTFNLVPGVQELLWDLTLVQHCGTDRKSHRILVRWKNLRIISRFCATQSRGPGRLGRTLLSMSYVCISQCMCIHFFFSEPRTNCWDMILYTCATREDTIVAKLWREPPMWPAPFILAPLQVLQCILVCCNLL